MVKEILLPLIRYLATIGRRTLSIMFPPGPSVVYLRIENTDLLKWPVFVWSHEGFSQFKTKEYFKIAASIGVVIFAFFASIIFFLTIKQFIYLYMGFYNLFFLIFELLYLGLLDQIFVLPRDLVPLKNEILLVTGNITCVFVSLFTISFLKIKSTLCEPITFMCLW